MKTISFQLLLMIIALVSLVGCKKERIDAVTVDARNMAAIKLRSIFEVVDTNPLGMWSDLPIGNFDRVLLCKDRIIVGDNSSSKILCFDYNGKLLYSTGDVGHADNEYIKIRDIAANDSCILVLDATGVLYYDISDGHFVKRVRPFEKVNSWDSFTPDRKGGYYYFSASEPTTIGHMTERNEDIPVSRFVCCQMVTTKFYEFKDTICVLPDWGDYTIYYIKDDKLVPRYTLELGNNTIPENIRPQEGMEFATIDMQRDDLYRSVIYAFENSHFLITRIVGPENKYYDIFYNKTTHAVLSGECDSETFYDVVGTMGEEFFVVVYPDNIKETSPLYKLMERRRALGSDNPFLFKVRIKEEALL